MKKLMIAFTAAAMAVSVNAATVTWGSGTITLPSGTQAGKDAVTAYLFTVTESVYNSYASYSDAAKLSTDIYAAYKGSLGTANATKTSNAKGVAKLSDDTDYAAGTYYAIVLYTATDSGIEYYMGNYGMQTVESTMDVELTGLANTLGGAGTTTTAWSTAAVPEPTSGLLLLLGVAGLALKRKRA